MKKYYKEIFNKSIEISAQAGFDFANGKPIQEIMQRYNTKSE